MNDQIKSYNLNSSNQSTAKSSDFCYIPLRNHSTYSLCQGAIKIPDLIDQAKKFKFPAIGICDSTNLFGALEFSSICKKSGIQPIIGCELKVDFNMIEQKKNSINISNLYHYLLLTNKATKT